MKSTALVVLLTVGPLAAQQPAPKFDAAVVKRNMSGAASSASTTRPGGRVTVVNETLRNIVRGAYGRRDLQVLGGPAWIDTERWDILATSGVEASGDSAPLLMRSLLADRFKLVVHTETREQPIYALVNVRANGLAPGLRLSTVQCARPSGGCGAHTTPGNFTATAQTMADTAINLTAYAGRRVVDKTGLSGRFDFVLSWEPDDGSLFTALQEQLGLKLESQRGPVEVVVIDSVEHATDD